MDNTSSKYSRTEFQQQTADWLLRGEYNAMVTLTFSAESGVSYKFAEKAFGAFAHKLKCHLFCQKSKKRILMCPIVEDFGAEMMWSTSPRSVRQGTHIHCLMRLPGNPMDYKEVVRNLWRSSGELCGDPNVNCPFIGDWFVCISTEQDRSEMTHSVLKKRAQDIDGVLVKFMPTRSTT